MPNTQPKATSVLQMGEGRQSMIDQKVCSRKENKNDESGIRTHAPEEMRTLISRLRPTRPSHLTVARRCLVLLYTHCQAARRVMLVGMAVLSSWNK